VFTVEDTHSGGVNFVYIPHTAGALSQDRLREEGCGKVNGEKEGHYLVTNQMRK
jgi:hypothetical protein